MNLDFKAISEIKSFSVKQRYFQVGNRTKMRHSEALERDQTARQLMMSCLVWVYAVSSVVFESKYNIAWIIFFFFNFADVHFIFCLLAAVTLKAPITNAADDIH